MQRRNDSILYSASDLVAFLTCRHSTTLALQDLDSPLPRAKEDATAALVMAKGMEHERAVLADLKARGRVIELPEHGDPMELAGATAEAMRDGAPVIYQGTITRAPLYGRTDFLRRVDTPSRLGDYSYEVVDTKLARNAKAKFAVQLAFYSDLLSTAQGVAPHQMHVVLGDGRETALRVGDYDHYVGEARTRYLSFVSERPATQPARCEACKSCTWRDVCNERWRSEDHLNQVAGIRREQLDRLNAASVATVAQLAALSPDAAVARVTPDTVRRLVAQASLQVARRSGGEPAYELLALDADGRRGFNRLPVPDAGDVFFDMEGDPLQEGGLEYLFGVRYEDGAGVQFRPFWAHDRTRERRAFEDFIDFVTDRVRRHPDLHVYHYSHYEPAALKRLMTQHGTREAQLDDLLRREKFVDLYKVVRESIRTSEPGLSIKDLEVFYMGQREGEIRDAGGSIVHYEAWKQTCDSIELERIRAYNEDDCRSTHLLRDWILGLRPLGLPWFAVSRDKDDKANQRSERIIALEARLAHYRDQLLDGIAQDESGQSPDERVRALLADLVDFHRRADKPQYWALFARRDLSDDELVDDAECLGALERTQSPPVPVSRSQVYEYAFPPQETKLRVGDVCVRCDTAERLGTIHTLDEAGCRVGIKISGNKEAPARLSIGLEGPVNTDALRDAVWRVAEAVIADEAARFRAGRAFLRRDPPSLRDRGGGAPLIADDSHIVAEARRAVEALDESYLFVQGPPGAGKTTIGSQLIVDLLRAGKRVGVTSNSHKVIHNLLDAVERVAARETISFDGVQKSSNDESKYAGTQVQSVRSNDDAVASGAQLLAGTAWLFADPRLEGSLDYLFVDEAGQVSLANLLAVATSARNLVLLGDHMQLGQPIQGKHPGRSGDSALDFLLDGEATVPADRGIFLPTSWRMHEDVCRFISNAVYDSRLHPDAANQRRRVVLGTDAHPALRPTGIRFVPVLHDGCRQRSRPEAQTVKDLVDSLCRQRWADKDGVDRPITLYDILVVAPYNAQVNLLRDLLPQGARVGTIDKFQGQQAPVVLVSMATSSGRDLPRNIEFLYDKNRLNVAVSRAMCLAVVVASPVLLHVDCNTPVQIALVNTLCWLKSYADALPVYPG